MATGSGVTASTISALNGLPFENIIGGPLNACVLAQKEAALTTLDFINSVGLQTTEDGKVEAIYVYFTFVQNGRKVNISVPLLTIVPIPYIAINTIDINFKASISGSESRHAEKSSSLEASQTKKSSKKGLGFLSVKSNSMTSTISTKKDSKATKDSSYSIEATLDVAVHASQDSMPAGMAKILEMLGNAIDLCNPEGELTVSNENPAVGDTVTVTYKGANGLYLPKCILVKNTDDEVITLATTKDGSSAVFSPTEAKGYTISISGDKENETKPADITITAIAKAS